MMMMWRVLFLLGGLVGLSGCPETHCAAGEAPSGSSARSATMALVGEQVNLRFSPGVVPSCSIAPFEERPSSLSVEVYGPDNLLVASQATLGNPSTSTSTVKFTPDKPGRYHVFAAFDPVGGILQFDLYAARNRTSEAPVFTLPKMCNALERTERGGWMCDLDFIRDGTVAQHFANGRTAVAGNVVWVASASQFARYVDTGTELELTASLPSSLGNAEFLLATETELLSVRGLTVERLVYDGTAVLGAPGRVQLPSTSGMVGTTGLSVVLLRSGDRLGVVTKAPSGGVVQPINSFTSQICAYRLEPARIVRTADPCQTFSGNVVGYEPGGLWVGAQLAGDQFDDLRWLEWSEAGIAEQVSLPLGFNFKMSAQPISPRNWVVPVISSLGLGATLRSRSTVAVYSPERRAILLEFLDDELESPNASGALVWTNPNSAGLTARVRVRPAAPVPP